MPYTIALIEDEPAIRDMYAIKLRAENYTVVTADDGITAFEVIKHTKPDLILLDIRLPYMPGNILLRKIRETDWGANIKVIVLTNISRNEAPQDFAWLEVKQYIVKAAYTPRQVIQIINDVLDD